MKGRIQRSQPSRNAGGRGARHSQWRACQPSSDLENCSILTADHRGNGSAVGSHLGLSILDLGVAVTASGR